MLRGGLAFDPAAGCDADLRHRDVRGGVAGFMLPVMAYSFAPGLGACPTPSPARWSRCPIWPGLAAALLGAVQMGSGGVTGYIVNALYNGTALPLAGMLAWPARLCGVHLFLWLIAHVAKVA